MLETLKKQRLFFIALIGIVVVSLTMTATFAYQTLQVDESEGSDTGVVLNVGTLDVSFEKSNKIENINMPLLSSYKTADYVEFVVDNARSTDDIAYQISLENLEYSSNLSSKDFNYTVTEIKDNEEIVLSTGDFSDLSKVEPYSIEYTLKLFDRTYNYITVGEKQTIRLYLWLKETNENQNYLEKTSFKGTITLTSLFKNEIPMKLSDKILANAEVDGGITRTKYHTISNTSLGTPSNEDERLLLTTKDNDGISYYYRGNVEDNYMNFEGMCFRIVRILGNGNIKLVLADENNECNSKLITKTSSLIGGYTNEFNYTNLETNLTKWLNGETITTDNTNTIYTPKKNLSESKNIVEAEWCKETKETEEISLECKEENEITSKIGILTVDEIIYSGSSIEGDSLSHYLLSNTESEYMTNSSQLIDDKIVKINVKDNGRIEKTESEKNIGIRPSIVIDKEVLYATGDGTIDNPYIIY